MQIDSKLYEWETTQEIFKDKIIPCSFDSHHKVRNHNNKDYTEQQGKVCYPIKQVLVFYIRFHNNIE